MADYFQRFTPNPADVVRVYELFQLIQARYLARASGGKSSPFGELSLRQARLVEAARLKFERNVEAVAQATVAVIDRAVLGQYDHTQVRPDTGASPNLRSVLDSSEIVATPVPAGVVGVVRLDKLDEFEYWKAQEFGLREGFVGREIHGWFFDAGGGSPHAPDPAEFREHPIFGASSTAPVSMTIKNPIAARGFLRAGVRIGQAYWRGEMTRVVAQATRDLNAVVGLPRGRA